MLLLFFIWKTMSLSSLKIMKKSPITEYSDNLNISSYRFATILLYLKSH